MSTFMDNWLVLSFETPLVILVKQIRTADRKTETVN